MKSYVFTSKEKSENEYSPGRSAALGGKTDNCFPGKVFISKMEKQKKSFLKNLSFPPFPK